MKTQKIERSEILRALNVLERDKNEILKKYNMTRKNETRHRFSIFLYQIDANIEKYRKQLENE